MPSGTLNTCGKEKNRHLSELVYSEPIQRTPKDSLKQEMESPNQPMYSSDDEQAELSGQHTPLEYSDHGDSTAVGLHSFPADAAGDNQHHAYTGVGAAVTTLATLPLHPATTLTQQGGTHQGGAAAGEDGEGQAGAGSQDGLSEDDGVLGGRDGMTHDDTEIVIDVRYVSLSNMCSGHS